jgi:hypothetical protein
MKLAYLREYQKINEGRLKKGSERNVEKEIPRDRKSPVCP